ncbi:porin family protein [Paraburkholderia xenovorans]|uniref:hypothetical protein n=1 Tax=Paraburkholderia xenovorans TaxID=36873 RepID=UPI0038B7A141
MSGEFIQIDAGNGQTFSAYMAKPRQGSGPGNVSATGQEPHYHEVDASADYFLSKSTDVYGSATYMRAGGGAVADLAPVLQASSSANQIALRVGIRKKF